MKRPLIARISWQCAVIIALLMSAAVGSAKEVTCDLDNDEVYDAKVAARDIDSVFYRVRRQKCLFDVNGVTATLSVAGEYERLVGTPQVPGVLATDSISSVDKTALAKLIVEAAEDDQDTSWQQAILEIVGAGLNECLRALTSNESTPDGAPDQQSSASMRCLTLQETSRVQLGRVTVRLNSANDTVHKHRIIAVSNHSTHWAGFVIPVVGQ